MISIFIKAAAELAIIQESFRDMEAKVCLKFVTRTNETDFLEIILDRNGCWTPMGRVGGKQELNLIRNICLSKKLVKHELFHTLGFAHMQNSFDRDNYIKVAWENMNQTDYPSLMKVDQKYYSYFGTKYDYESITHYPGNYFSINGTLAIC